MEEYDYEHENHEIPEETRPSEHAEVTPESPEREDEPPIATEAPTLSSTETTVPYVEPTTPFDPNCGPDRGGCDHECRKVWLDHESHVECSCYPGYELNVRDGRTCNGK